MEVAKKALQAFKIEGAVNEIALFGSGHINDSYLVSTDEKKFLLQKLNDNVFRKPQVVEENLFKLLHGQSNLFVRHYRTETNSHHQNESGFWRLTDFMEDAYAPTLANDTKEVYEAAKGFGCFTSFASELDPEEFLETIPKFHDLKWRLQQLNEAVEENSFGRLQEIESLISDTNNLKWVSEQMDKLIERGLPKRVCHNDTKLDNCLLAKEDHSFKHIIDLDTIGPGYVLFDFGDLMRTTLSPTKENELDESKIEIRLEFLTALKEGFLSSCENMLTNLEKENLLFGGLYMSYIMGVRFLTDYLNGDTYYKTSFEKENLIRARNQLKLATLIGDYEC